MKKNTLTSKGFTLIETLFAILIFSASLISLLAISSKGIGATREVKNESTAYYLAQEGLEVVRTIRDANYIALVAGGSGAWTDGFAGGITDCTVPAGCFVQYSSVAAPTLGVTSGASSDILYAAGVYGNIGSSTGFSRVIHVTPSTVPGSDEYIISSTVTWKAKTITKTVTLQTLLKKWQ